MEEILKVIENIGIKNIILIVSGVVVFIVLLMIIKSIRLKKLRKQIVEIENKMNGIKSMPIQYRLGRVKSIAQNMSEVVEDYEKYAKEFEDLSEFQKDELALLVNEVDEQLFYGRIRRVPRKMKELNAMLDEYEKRSQELLTKIEKITEVENIQRVEIIRVKEKYRHTIDYFETIRFKVEDFVPALLEKFNVLDDSFVQLEGFMNNQKIEEARVLTKKIDEEVDLLNSKMNDLPGCVAVVRNYIPKKIETIQQMISEMSKEEFYLNQLDVSNRLNVIQSSLDEAITHIKKLETDNIAEVLQTLVDSIEELIQDLENEKQSYNAFKEEWDACYEFVTQIYDQYKGLLRDYRRITKLYVVDDLDIGIEEEFKDFDKILKESYDLEDELKNGEFSYLQMLQKVRTLKNEASIHNNYLTSFTKTRDHLYLQEKRAIDELDNINIVLLEIKSEIKNHHLPMINDSYKDYIQDSYDKAAQIQMFRQNRPVRLEELAKRVDEARDVIYKLYDNVHNLIVTAEMVEEAIVFGNRYRSTFLEVNTELTKAEVLFRNGEYTKALSTAVDIIEKIQPGSYEELIRKSNKKSI